jgi:hypothetical protein
MPHDWPNPINATSISTAVTDRHEFPLDTKRNAKVSTDHYHAHAQCNPGLVAVGLATGGWQG